MKSKLAQTFLLVAALTFLTACTPRTIPTGKLPGQPHIDGNRFIASDGTPLPFRTWLPEGTIRAVVVALHGFNDYSNAFQLPCTYFTRHGIACYAYDQRGFGNTPDRGLWAGAETYAADLVDVAGAVRTRHPGLPLYLLGESMGGAVTMVAASGTSTPDADGLILVAPAVWARETMPWYQRLLLALTSHTVPWMKLTGGGLGITPSDNIDMRRGLGRDPLVIKGTRIDAMYGLTNLMDLALAGAQNLKLPALVLYGKKDQVIPSEPTLRMLAKAPPTTRPAFYDNGYHMLLRDLERNKPLEDIVAWVGNRNGPLPHGRERWE